MFRRLAFAVVILVPQVAAADIYQYTDADGVIHFTTSAPTGGAKVVARGGGLAGRAFAPYLPQDKDPSRFTRYDIFIREAATLYQIPEQLVRAVIKVESDYDPRAVSVSGARGLMQLMPETADRMQVRDINDPRENIFGGTRLLRILANTFNGDLSLTLAAYNAGPESVVKYGGIPPFQQTRDYVTKVSGFYKRYRTMPDTLEASLGAIP